MKDKILMFIIGLLIGGIITAVCFLIFSNKTNQSDFGKMNRPNMENFPQKSNNEKPMQNNIIDKL